MARIAVAQMRVEPTDHEANLAKALDLIGRAAAEGAELVLLPEMALTGLAQDVATVAQPIPGPATEALGEMAAERDIWVIAGMPEANPGGKPYNSAVAINPRGEIADVYRKVFLYLGEADACDRGDRACLLDLGFCQAGLMICYDYIFPEYVRRLVMAGARLILHPTAWGDTEACRQWHYPAAEAYRAQGRVRARENGVFVASANGLEQYDAEGYLGGVGRSAIIAPWGEVLAEVPDGDGVAVADLDFARIEEWTRDVAPYLRDFREVPIPEV